MSKHDAARVTVVIPAYKAGRTIERAVDSVLYQPGCRATIIVVVDGNFDTTKDILRQRYGGGVKVVVNETNQGVQYSRNRGLAAVRDDWVMFLDSDDFIEPPLLRELVDALTRSDADIGFGPMCVFHERSGKRGPQMNLSGSDQEIFVDWLSRGRFAGTCSVLWRTAFLRQIGGWDPELRRQEDGEAVLRGILLGARTVRSRQGCGVYVMHRSPDRLTRRNDNLDSLLKVPEKLLAIASTRFSADIVKGACAAGYYNAARTCYTRGLSHLGKLALARSRALGFQGHQGSTIQRALSMLLGLRVSCKLEGHLRKLAGRAV